ncbi:unnamed protein product [Cuscuta epithymum]|uniref:Germin-like protein n=1 Tax=Cuscuta epithymum TaxID=186058 RepID=A0AAV0EUJ1_9ASTE|nr:unnamed protein product [Cuscuta epithymum]
MGGFAVIFLWWFSFGGSRAYDPSPLQEYCVAVDQNSTNGVFVNGRFCKDPAQVEAKDFFASGLNASPYPAAFPGSNFSFASVTNMPGLNTGSLTLIRNDYQGNTVIPPHTHPRAVELAVVVKGSFYFAFVASDPYDANKPPRLFEKWCGEGDAFTVPQGLTHFGLANGSDGGTTYTVFNSQSPGFHFVTTDLFAAPIPAGSALDDVLKGSFGIDDTVLQQIRDSVNRPQS